MLPYAHVKVWEVVNEQLFGGMEVEQITFSIITCMHVSAYGMERKHKYQ